MLKFIVYLLLASTSLAYELDWTVLKRHNGQSEISTCSTLLKAFTWGFTKPKAGRSKNVEMCMYPPATGTMLLCVNEYANGDEGLMNKVFKLTAKNCEYYGEYTASYFEDQFYNATEFYQPLDSFANISEPIYSPTIPNLKKGITKYKGYLHFYENLDKGTYFSEAIYGYFLLLIIIGTIYNFIRVSGYTKTISKSKMSKACQKYIIFPSLLPSGKYAQEYGWKWFSILFPNRIQFLVDLGLFALQVGFYCAPYHEKEGLFTSPSLSLQRMLADRTGIMAFGKIPLLILFAGRNNFLLYLTGWSYTTFLHYHKIVAMWMCVDALIHSVGYTIYVLGRYTTNLKETYFACGVAATVLAFVMSGFAIHTVRKHYYEYFLMGHILMGVGFIVMCWYHCHELGWMEWMVAACVVWFLDRLLRISRMAGFGYRDATITTVDNELIEIVVKRPSWWTTETGQYGYIYFADLLFWQNHPFTLVCKEDKIIGYIKIKNGFTKRLWKQITENGGSITKKICIEGPYGTIGSGGAKKMDDVLLFAGGSGAPAIIDAASYITRGKLFWIVPNLSMAKGYSYLMKNVKIQTCIYVTKETGVDGEYPISEVFNSDFNIQSRWVDDCTSSDDNKSDDKENTISDSLNTVTISYHRPNIEQILHDEIVNSAETNVGIVGCGPPGMMDALRTTISKNVDSYNKSINFYDELQVW